MSTQHRHQIPHCRARALALAIALALAPLALMAQSLPGELPRAGNVVRGDASISYNPSQFTDVALQQATTITQTTRGAVIEWGSFSIGAQNTVTFDHQVAGGVTLNRVIGFPSAGVSPSTILGSLNAPRGSVFLVNPSGILFGAGSSVSVGGLIASTLDISNDNFDRGVSTGAYDFGTGVTFQGNVENDGTITANPGGTVALLGGRVQNGNGTDKASISAPQGTVAFGVGSQITVNIGGDGLTQLQIGTYADNANGTYAQNSVNGEINADGGQVLMQALGSSSQVSVNPFTSVVNSGTVRARSMLSRAGRIVLSGASIGGLGAVNVQGGTLDVSGSAPGVRGGSVELIGDNVSVLGQPCWNCAGPPPPPTPSLIDASGSVAGGTISITARNVAAIDAFSTLTADATDNGNGGSIIVNGTNGLYAFGRFSAQGGVNGGDGGLVETSGSGISVGGIQVSANAPRGIAGQWLIDPYDVTIVHGNAAGSLPTSLFDPIVDSIIQDADINNALDGGSNVTISTGTGGLPDAGNIYFDGNVEDPINGLPLAVDILRSTGTAPLTFRLDAHAGIAGTNFQIHSTAGALNVIFDSDAQGSNSDNGLIAFTDASIRTNGGNLSMYGQDDPVGGFAASRLNGGIQLEGVTIDTRIGGNDANASGNILLRGGGSCVRFCLGRAVVGLIGSNLYASTGSIQIGGFGAIGLGANSGVALDSNGNGGPGTVVSSTSGAITMIGVGAGDGAVGQYLGAASVRTIGGNIDLRGHGDVDGTLFSDGLDIAAAAAVSSASGLTLLSGSSDGSGAGINVAAGAVVDAGSGNIVARVHNNGSTDALVLGGTLGTGGVIDLRPGSVSASGALVENPDDVIVLGGSTGFGITAAELGNLNATTLILGSSIQAGAISVLAPVVYGHNLTLQTGAGIALNAALDVGTYTLALIGAGNITQTAPITADSLLVESSAGSVMLMNSANRISAATLAGSASGSFSFVNAGGVSIGNVTATGFDATGDVTTSVTGSGVSGGGDVLVRALDGNLVLGADVSGNNVDLVSTGIFANTGGNAITAAGNWQVWGSSWVDESRAGLAGNGSLPNLYGCTFAGACGVTPSTTANQFIYTVQPVATITFADSTREYGLPNAGIDYAVAGMILGDAPGNAISGDAATVATQASGVGNYAISGTFVSPAGYIVDLVPGVLAITPATLLYEADPYRRLVGTPNGILGGFITGFRNGDTLSSATEGSLQFLSAADAHSPVGMYAINGYGLVAANYVFVQAAGNATALTVTPPLAMYVPDIVRDTPVTYLYDSNFGIVGLCPAIDLAAGSREVDGDTLSREWARVRSRPNLANCVSTRQKDSCGDF